MHLVELRESDWLAVAEGGVEGAFERVGKGGVVEEPAQQAGVLWGAEEGGDLVEPEEFTGLGVMAESGEGVLDFGSAFGVPLNAAAGGGARLFDDVRVFGGEGFHPRGVELGDAMAVAVTAGHAGAVEVAVVGDAGLFEGVEDAGGHVGEDVVGVGERGFAAVEGCDFAEEGEFAGRVGEVGHFAVLGDAEAGGEAGGLVDAGDDLAAGADAADVALEAVMEPKVGGGAEVYGGVEVEAAEEDGSVAALEVGERFAMVDEEGFEKSERGLAVEGL